LKEEVALMRIRFTLAIVLFCELLDADPVVHTFKLWGTTKPIERMSLYWGWTNGFLQARGERAVGLADCLDRISTDQALAMIDKHYKDHPEKWSRPLGAQMLEALTVAGGPCEGKNPLAP
jgi:hypothetical protein